MDETLSPAEAKTAMLNYFDWNRERYADAVETLEEIGRVVASIKDDDSIFERFAGCIEDDMPKAGAADKLVDDYVMDGGNMNARHDVLHLLNSIAEAEEKERSEVARANSEALAVQSRREGDLPW